MSRRINRTHAETRSKLLALIDDPNTDQRTKAKAAAGLAAIEVASIKLRTLREREAAREKRIRAKQAEEDKHRL